MKTDLSDLTAFLAVAQARGFRKAARVTGGNPSTMSEAVRRLESRLGVRLLIAPPAASPQPRLGRG